MTIINRSHGFIFVHIPKTGGTSLKESLRGCRSPADVHIERPSDMEVTPRGVKGQVKKHSTALQVREVVGTTEFERLFKFCVVRNPFIRTISLFKFLKFNFRAWPRSDVMDRIHSLEEFVASPLFRSAGPGRIVSPQVHWIADKSGINCMDFVARMEKIEDDFHVIGARLGLPAGNRPLLRKNASRGDTMRLVAELESARVVDAIRTRYASDFRLLEYSTEPDDAVGLEAGGG